MLKGKDEAVQRQSNLIMFIDFAQNELVYLSRVDSDLTTSGRAKCLETAIKLLEIICEGEENALFYNVRLASCYQQLARMYSGFYNSEDLDKNKAVEYLLCAERTGKRFDQCQSGEPQYYKSLFLNNEKFVPHNTLDGYVVNSSESLLHFIRLFDGFKNLSDHPEFIALMERLEKAK